jgi:hypothetical protein
MTAGQRVSAKEDLSQSIFLRVIGFFAVDLSASYNWVTILSRLRQDAYRTLGNMRRSRISSANHGLLPMTSTGKS